MEASSPQALRHRSIKGRILTLIGWTCVAALLVYVFQLTAGRSVHNVLIVRGDALVGAGAEEGALQAYTAAILSSPSDPSSYLKRANVYRHVGQNSAALNDLNQALTLQLERNDTSNTASLLVHRGANLLQLGRTNEAIADLSKALADNPNDFTSLSLRARAYAAQQQWGQATDDISRVISAKPTDAPSLAFRARLNTITNQLPAAIEDATLAIRTQPQDPRYYSLRATLYQRTNQPDLQQQDLTRVIEFDPNQFEPYAQRGRAREKSGDIAGALADLNQAVALEPQSASLYTERGAFYERNNQSSKAEQDYRSALEINQNYLQAQLRLGMLLLRQQHPDQAEGELSKAIALSADNAEAYLKRAQARFDLGRYDAALQDASQAVGLSPNAVQPYLLRARIRAATPDLSGATANLFGAIADLNKVIELDENILAAWLERANLYARQANYEAAIADYTAVLTRNPAFVSALVGRAHAYRASGENALAVKDYQAAVKNLQSTPLRVNAVYPPAVATQFPSQTPDGAALREVQLLSEQGQILRELDRLGDAEAALQQAISLDSGSIAIVIRIASVYQADNKLGLAQAALELALVTNPDNAVLTLRLVHVLEDQDKYADAENIILKSESLRAQRSSLLFELGELYERHDLLDQAVAVDQTNIDFLSTSLSQPSDATDQQLPLDVVAVRMGHLHYLLKQYEQAIQDSRLALRWNPEDALAYHGMGMAKIKLGADCDAIGDMQTYLSLAPSAEDAQSVNAWLQKDHRCVAPVHVVVPIAQILSGIITTPVNIEGKIVGTDNFTEGFKLYLNDGTGQIPILIRAAPYDEITDTVHMNTGAIVRFTGKPYLTPISQTIQFDVSHGRNVSIITPAPDPTSLWQSHTLGEMSGNDFNATVVLSGTVTDVQPYGNPEYGSGVLVVLTDPTGSQILRLRSVVATRVAAAGNLRLSQRVQVVGHVKARQKVGLTIDVLLPQDITSIR
jgi:tetratricopeptide (TPR) repeat protein